MIRTALLLSLGWLPLAASSLAAQEGRLQQVRDEIRPKDNSSSNIRTNKDGGSNSDDDSVLGNLFGEMFCQAACYTLMAPFCLPYLAMGDDWDKFLYFPKGPYQISYPGYLMIDPAGSPEFDEKWGKACQPKTWGLQLALENGNDFDGLNRVGGRAVLETTSRIGILTSWNYYRENLCDGSTDNMVIGDFNVTYRFAQRECAMMRAGLGFRTRADHGAADFGFNFHYGADFFPVNPVVLSTSIDLGNLGSAGVVHLRGTAGLTRNGWEIFAGYDWLRIGDVNLQGPMVGLRLWF